MLKTSTRSPTKTGTCRQTRTYECCHVSTPCNPRHANTHVHTKTLSPHTSAGVPHPFTPKLTLFPPAHISGPASRSLTKISGPLGRMHVKYGVLSFLKSLSGRSRLEGWPVNTTLIKLVFFIPGRHARGMGSAYAHAHSSSNAIDVCKSPSAYGREDKGKHAHMYRASKQQQSKLRADTTGCGDKSWRGEWIT